MLSHALSALSARRNAVKEGEKGFTLIELLVVVIIIGILAAIAIPVYLGIQNNAKDSATKSDLTSWKTSVIAAQTQNGGTLPTTAPSDVADDSGSTGVVYKSGTDTTTGNPTFCISATSKSTKSFKITDSTSVGEGTC